uniref:Uncharacterized protein n=1 Tax=Rhizophora mucronata TaxID=61149 RepID=A0A2P2QQP0_RHIMU
MNKKGHEIKSLAIPNNKFKRGIDQYAIFPLKKLRVLSLCTLPILNSK